MTSPLFEPKQATLLMEAAQQAAQNAYAPYSHFKVGAAALTASGQLITGCNVENASYGLTLCAERTALVKAVSDGHTQLVAMAVWAEQPAFHSVTPCGACRQVLSEWLPPDAPIYHFEAASGQLVSLSMAELLPGVFRLPPPSV